MSNENETDRLADEVFQRLCTDKGSVNMWNFHIRPIRLAMEVLEQLDIILSRDPETWNVSIYPQDVHRIREDIAILMKELGKRSDNEERRESEKIQRNSAKDFAQREKRVREFLGHAERLSYKPRWNLIEECLFRIRQEKDSPTQEHLLGQFQMVLETCIKRRWYSKSKIAEMLNDLVFLDRLDGGSYCCRPQLSPLPLSPIDGNAARVAPVKKRIKDET